jgi:hypothetical protein
VKITFTAMDCVPVERLARNVAHAKSLGLPLLGQARAPFLAVVGGGPSVADHVDELRDWAGEVWAINGTYRWLTGQGIWCRFFSTDPMPGIADLCKGADAILATRCDQDSFAAAGSVETVDIEDMPHGPTTASCAPLIAAQCGFQQVSVFGCEGSFGGETHAYGTPRDVRLLKVMCNGQEFLTSPQMMQQTEYLADIMRETPQFCIDRSGGFLSACIADPDIDVIAASRSIYEQVIA